MHWLVTTSGVCYTANPFKHKIKDNRERRNTNVPKDIVLTEDSVMRNESGILAKLANQELAC